MSKTIHLTRRGAIYYYYRRLPEFVAAATGEKVIKYSLKTHDVKQARKLAEIEDVKWSAKFDAIANHRSAKPTTSTTTSATDAVDLIRDYVTRTDRRARQRNDQSPPHSRQQLDEMKSDAEVAVDILRDRNDPRGLEWITDTASKLAGSGSEPEAIDGEFEQLVRRGLLEIGRRRVTRLDDDFAQPFFDALFNPNAPKRVTFGDLADQYLRDGREDAEINKISQKRVDKVEANVALIREIIGPKTLVSAIDYDAVLRVRSILARTATNRTKHYPKLTVEAVAAKAKADGKPILSATTQGQYLETLKGILELAALKRLIPHNPAQSVRPLKRDDTSANDKRRPFTLDQIKAFFTSGFYVSCAPGAAAPYHRKDREWRFWLPLLCLFMGMRPSEICQMLAGDMMRTKNGTWYVDVAASADDDDEVATLNAAKTVKTTTSRRRIPIHPELIAIGFLSLKKGKGPTSRLFPGLKPDKYGNLATYALRRFRETFLPEAMTVENRQSFYSFRHSFRDALRRIDAQPATLQALGGWSQGSLVSDAYGDQGDPDYQAKFVAQIAFDELDLSFLHATDLV